MNLTIQPLQVFLNDLIWETETRFVRTLESIMSSMSHFKHDKNGPPTFKGKKREDNP